jgi:riboflavin synthase
MFTGIVREVGTVESIEPAAGGGARLVVRAPETADGIAQGESVSVAGVCLTATEIHETAIAFDAVPETLARTTLGALEPGARTNLEAALRAGDPMGGHLVQGHVDGVGTVLALEPEGDGARLTVGLPENLTHLTAEKGSIAIDGVSLTIAALDGTEIEIALVPRTLAETTLGGLAAGDRVNVETDILARQVERLLEARR